MYTFSIPNLGECTLEMLMVGFLMSIGILMEQHLNDEMQRIDTVTKALLEKIAKTYHDMNQEGSEKKLSIDGRSLVDYLSQFHWDEERFPEKSSIGEHKNVIQQVKDERVFQEQDGKRLESELKKMLQKYQDVHGNLTAMKRKRGSYC